MSEAARHRGSFPSISTILARIALGCVVLASSSWLPKAHAGTLYRCTGASGETVFTGSAAGYRDCRKLGDYGVSARRPAPASLKNVRGVAVGTRTRAEIAATLLATVRGGVFTTAGSSAADALPPASAVPASLRGHWTYSQQGDGSTALSNLPAATEPGDRVLRGAVYRVLRADGSVEYTNIPPGRHVGQMSQVLFTYIATCFACNLHSNIHWGSVPLDLTDYAAVIRSASVEYGVDEAFIRAVIHAESAFNPRAMSIKGAQGLMQLMPGTASDMGVLDAFDSGQNIRGGARYLALLLRDFNGDEHLAAAAYNAGPAAVQKYNGVPPYDETRVYVQRVDILRKRYAAALHPPLAAARPG